VNNWQPENTKNIAITHLYEYNSYCDLTTKEVNLMAKTQVRENESLDEALRRFKRQVNKSGVLKEARKREFYLKPGVKRKMKIKEARKNRY